MNDVPYSNREIKQFFDGLHEKIDMNQTNNDKKFDTLIEQTTRHNGRMSKIELKQARSNGFMAGIWIVVSIVVVPILAWSLMKLVNLDNTISAAISNAQID